MCHTILPTEKVGASVEIVLRYFWAKVGLILITGNVVFLEDMANQTPPSHLHSIPRRLRGSLHTSLLLYPPIDNPLSLRSLLL